METHNKRGKVDIHFREMPETETTADNTFLNHPNRAPKEEEGRTQTGSDRAHAPQRS